jgi:ABC-type nitrate/sulfonate/bicarbonate transport system substrate-binding protein
MALVGRPGPVIGQTLRKIKYTNPWLPVGTFVFSYVARRMGFWSRRGLDVEVARGYGSVAAAQAIGLGQFDFGCADSSVITMQQAKGIPLVMIGQLEYLPTQGIGILSDSPIRKPKDLEGKTLGGTPTSGEFPFLGAYASAAGFDLGKAVVTSTPGARAPGDGRVDIIGATFASPPSSREVDAVYALQQRGYEDVLRWPSQRSVATQDRPVEAFIGRAHRR